MLRVPYPLVQTPSAGSLATGFWGNALALGGAFQMWFNRIWKEEIPVVHIIDHPKTRLALTPSHVTG